MNIEVIARWFQNLLWLMVLKPGNLHHLMVLVRLVKLS